MRDELDKKLCAKYPKIFAQRNLPMIETALCWGFDCGDGWYWLIDNLCHSIQGYVDGRNEGVSIRKKAKAKYTIWQKLWNHLILFSIRKITAERGDSRSRLFVEEEWQVEATQVKEKFGGLRFYINGGDDHIYGMIWLAEVMSYGICEMCGTTENVSPTKGGWVKNLCPKCKEERSIPTKSYEKKN